MVLCTNSQSGDQVGESKSTCLLRFRLMLGENVRSFRSDKKMGKSSKRIATIQFLQRITWNWWEPIEFEWNIFQGLASMEILQKIQKDLQDRNIGPEDLKIESSSCRCSMTSNGQREEILNNVFQIPKKSRSMRSDSRENTGHSSTLETKRSASESPHRWWDASRKPVIQYSRASVLWVVEFWKETVTETLQCGCFDNRTRMSNDALSKSAQYLRSSLKLVWRVRSKAEWERADFGKVRGKREGAATEECETARSKFFGVMIPYLETDCENVFRTWTHWRKASNLQKFAKMRHSGKDSLLKCATRPLQT